MPLRVSLADAGQGLGSVDPAGSRWCRLESGMALNTGLAPKVPMSLLTTTLVDKHSNHGDLHGPTNICSNIHRGFLIHTGLTTNL